MLMIEGYLELVVVGEGFSRSYADGCDFLAYSSLHSGLKAGCYYRRASCVQICNHLLHLITFSVSTI